MISSTFKLELIKGEEKKEIKVVMQEANKFRVADAYTESITQGRLSVGRMVENLVPLVVMSPKNLLEQLEECDNSFTVIGTVSKEIESFLNNPKRYALLQIESKNKDNQPNESVGCDIHNECNTGADKTNE